MTTPKNVYLKTPQNEDKRNNQVLASGIRSFLFGSVFQRPQATLTHIQQHLRLQKVWISKNLGSWRSILPTRHLSLLDDKPLFLEIQMILWKTKPMFNDLDHRFWDQIEIKIREIKEIEVMATWSNTFHCPTLRIPHLPQNLAQNHVENDRLAVRSSLHAISGSIAENLTNKCISWEETRTWPSTIDSNLIFPQNI